MALRILLTTDVAGGVWTYTEELSDALAERGHRVVLASLGGEPHPAQRAWVAERPHLEFTALDAPLEWEPEPEPALGASVEALRALAERVRPDVIHLNQFYYGAFDFGAPKLVFVHSDVVSWWRALKGVEPPDDAWFRRYRRWVEAGLAGAGARGAPSAWMAEQARSIYGVPPLNVIHNARSPRRFAPRLGGREPLVVTAGRLWDEGKGAIDLAAAAGLRLRGVHSAEARVVVVGPIQHPAGRADFPVASPGVEWAGVLSQAELAKLLGRAAVYVATSRYEPFGLAPLEAALAGCALVLSEIPTFRELWDGAALYYAPGDAAALAEILRQLLREPGPRAELAAAARARALARFDPARMAEAYEGLYLELLATA